MPSSSAGAFMCVCLDFLSLSEESRSVSPSSLHICFYILIGNVHVNAQNFTHAWRQSMTEPSMCVSLQLGTVLPCVFLIIFP